MLYFHSFLLLYLLLMKNRKLIKIKAVLQKDVSSGILENNFLGNIEKISKKTSDVKLFLDFFQYI